MRQLYARIWLWELTYFILQLGDAELKALPLYLMDFSQTFYLFFTQAAS